MTATAGMAFGVTLKSQNCEKSWSARRALRISGSHRAIATPSCSTMSCGSRMPSATTSISCRRCAIAELKSWEMHNLLTETVAIPEARKWILDNSDHPRSSCLGLVDEIRSYLEGLSDRQLAETLIGGLSTYEVPEIAGGEMLKVVQGCRRRHRVSVACRCRIRSKTRDTTCWIYGGCTLNPLYWPARHEETILTTSIYKFHPDFAGKVNVWWGDPTHDHGLATLEGGDVMPIGKGTVLIGMSERTSRQAISQLAGALFAKGAAERVIVAAMPKLRAAMHLDTVFTFADRDCVLLYPDIVNNISAYSYRPADTPADRVAQGRKAVR